MGCAAHGVYYSETAKKILTNMGLEGSIYRTSTSYYGGLEIITITPNELMSE